MSSTMALGRRPRHRRRRRRCARHVVSRTSGSGELADAGGRRLDDLAAERPRRRPRASTCAPSRSSIDLDAAPASAGDVYLRLHLLSQPAVQPRTINLDGIFGLLANVAWTNLGPVAVDARRRGPLAVRSRRASVLTVHGLDKFPRMTDYVVPARRAHRRRRPRAPRRPPRRRAPR